MERLNNLPKVTQLIVIVELGFVSRAFIPKVCAGNHHRMEFVYYGGSFVLIYLRNYPRHLHMRGPVLCVCVYTHTF